MVLRRILARHRLTHVKHLIRTGRDVNAYDKSGWTPLLRAAFHGDVEVARELIRANADVHLKVKGSGRSVLCTAAYYVCQAWVKFYLFVMFILRIDKQVAGDIFRAKADNYWKIRGSGRTALHIAAYYGHQSLVKLFLETNINLNEQDDDGRTALILAVERGHRVVVAELVKAGADTSLKDKKGMTAVRLAKGYDMVGQLVRDVDHLSREDRSRILWHACNIGDLSMVQSVIEAGCDVDHIHKGQTPVMMATLRGHDSIVKEVILANCDVNLHSEGYYSDLASSLNLTQMIWPMAFLWLALVSGVWIPPTRTESIPIDPIQTSMIGVLSSALVVVGVLLVPGSGVVMLLGSGAASIAMFCIVRVVFMAGPVVSAVVPILTVIVLVVMTSMYWELLKTTAAAVVLCICAPVVLQFMMFTSFVWLVAMAGAATVIAIVFAKWMTRIVWIMTAFQRLLVTVTVVGLANVEMFVVSIACVKIAWDAHLLEYPEDMVTQLLVELLTVAVFMALPLLLFRPQNTMVGVLRGAVVLFGFNTMRMKEYVQQDGAPIGLLMVVLVMARIFADIGATITKKSTLLIGVMAVLHLVVAVTEVYLAVVIHKEGPQLQHWAGGAALITNLVVIMMMMTPIRAGSATALHYAAGHNRVKCGVVLVEAGADVRAKNKRLYTPFEIGFSTLENELKQVLCFTTKRVIAVIGNSECGKSTLVAALEHTSNILWKKAINHFKKVHDIRQRTTGIEAVQVSSQKYGEALFYDFAGQSQYHGPHQSFLEAMLSKPEASVTLLLLVKATEEEAIITQQLYHWLQPLALMSIPITPQVVVVGSFLDQVKSKKEASEKLLRCTQSVNTELALDIQGPCLLDCRQPESKGIDQICIFFEEARPVSTKALSYNLHWVLVQVRKAFSIPALQLNEFQTWLQDNARNLPRNLPSPDEVCQDLSAAGHTLFICNKQYLSKSWLILDLPGLLHNVYGTLFSGSLDSVNMFGLLHCSQLNELFPELCLDVIQGVLKSLEFCIEVDPALLEGNLLQLPVDKQGDGWLYFPALVSAQPSKDFPEDPDQNPFQWLCWQLRTAKKHFISARLLQTIILRLAANHVFIHELPGARLHCCHVWVNGISWRSTKGVNIAVQISDNSVVQVVGRSKAGSGKRLEYTSTVVQDIIKTATQLSPKLEATPYIVHPYMPTLWKDPKAAPPDSLYPVSSITRCIRNGDDHILSLPKEEGEHPQQRSLSEVFGWSPSLPFIQDMNFAEPSDTSARPLEAALNHFLSTPTLDELNQLVVWRVAAQWYEVGVFLEVKAAVMDTIHTDNPHSVKQACRDMFREWLSRGPGTGEQPRVWQSVLEAVKEAVGETVAVEIKRETIAEVT